MVKSGTAGHSNFKSPQNQSFKNQAKFLLVTRWSPDLKLRAFLFRLLRRNKRFFPSFHSAALASRLVNSTLPPKRQIVLFYETLLKKRAKRASQVFLRIINEGIKYFFSSRSLEILCSMIKGTTYVFDAILRNVSVSISS